MPYISDGGGGGIPDEWGQLLRLCPLQDGLKAKDEFCRQEFPDSTVY